MGVIGTVSGNNENPFNVKLGKIFAPNATGQFLSLAGRFRQAARATPKRKSRGSRSRFTPKAEDMFMDVCFAFDLYLTRQIVPHARIGCVFTVNHVVFK